MNGTAISTYAFDADRIFLSGDSAGGLLVLLMAAVQNSLKLQRFYNVTPATKGIRGVAASCPVADVRAMLESDRILWKLIRKVAFQSSLYRSEDYLHHISAPDIFQFSTYPKVFLSTTPTDGLVYQETKKLHELMNNLSIEHMYKEYEGRSNKLDHVFNVLFPQYEESIEANDDFLAFFRENK